MEIELNIPETEITGKDISVETGNTNIAVSEGTKDLDITYNRKEYSIIGDDIFISSVLDDVPEWLGDLIDSTFEAAILSRDQNLVNRMEAILTALDYVPKNRYTEQINQIVDEDGIINTRIATLNSNLTDALNTANATIAEINLTYASKNEAAAISTNVLTASLSANGEIGSTLINLQNVYADLERTTVESITTLESVMEGEIIGNASDRQIISGHTTQLSTVDARISDGVASVETKWAYNSVVNINGIYKKSGFGLTTNYTSGNGTKANPYVSEFWIDASRLKFTNSNMTGRTAPFTIDASGTTPQITFNGVVSFTNVSNTSGLISSISTAQSTANTAQSIANTANSNALARILPSEVAHAINTNTTTINGSKITTGTISANKISSYNLTATNAVMQNGFVTTLKIENEAVIVPRSAAGEYSCTIWYSPKVSHAATILGEWVQGGEDRDGVMTYIAINGVVARSEKPIKNTLASMFHNTYFYAGVMYQIALYSAPVFGMSCRLLLLGTKR